MPEKPKTVDEYLEIGCGRCELGGTPDCKVRSWEQELERLREILLESELKEQIKWGSPCYTLKGKNVLMLGTLKESVVVSFFRGAELKDPNDILEKPGENSRFARYLRVTDGDPILGLRNTILRYIEEAVELEKSGKPAVASDDGSMDYPEELKNAFSSDTKFEEAFESLTPGRQRGYLIHFSSAKQSKTRADRIEKAKEKIYAGKGWNER